MFKTGLQYTNIMRNRRRYGKGVPDTKEGLVFESFQQKYGCKNMTCFCSAQLPPQHSTLPLDLQHSTAHTRVLHSTHLPIAAHFHHCCCISSKPLEPSSTTQTYALIRNHRHQLTSAPIPILPCTRWLGCIQPPVSFS